MENLIGGVRGGAGSLQAQRELPSEWCPPVLEGVEVLGGNCGKLPKVGGELWKTSGGNLKWRGGI